MQKDPPLVEFQDQDGPSFPFKLSFFLLGFSSFIPWYSIILCLDFYNQKFAIEGLNFILPIPQLSGQFIFVFVTCVLSFYVNINTRIILTNCLMIIILLLLWMIPYFFEQNTISFIFLVLFIFVLGAITSINQTSSIALCYLFPNIYMSIYFLGCSFAGVLSALIRMTFMYIFPNNNDLSCILFILLSIIMIMSTIYLYMKMTQTRLFFHSLYKDWRKSLAHSIVAAVNLNLESFKGVISLDQKEMRKYMHHIKSVFSIDERMSEYDNLDYDLIKSERNSLLSRSNVRRSNLEKKIITSHSALEMSFGKLNNFHDHLENNNRVDFEFIKNSVKSIMPIPLLLFLLFIQTMCFFPGYALKKNLAGVGPNWSCILLILVFNVGETLGKYITLLWMKLSRNTAYILVFSRFLFFGSFYYLVHGEEFFFFNEDLLIIMNLFLFSFSQGFLANCLFGFAQINSKESERETVGILMNMFLVFGLAIGSVLSLIMKDI